MSIDDLMASMLSELGKEVDAELADNNFPAHHHGRPIGYHNGCRGPLCKKQHRDRLRRPGAVSASEIQDAYLEMRLNEHKKSLKDKKKAGHAA
ncbi:hypothetical protein TIN4_103 [Tsukamurella phage TIN4]|uniref:Uncharacterized protein n=2 Tax=Tinduovirus TIN3 TaxID=1982571 RepID=A0A0K0N665_9CAUD|nr:hypothetical protein AVT54_gp022 [Tsukamurella phage TIN3]YP_009604233.1 hypothetical protein FDH87_gp022 [Tsukamurella phage TIN4]AKJ71900.1 hypothetical protein TIN3_103 [Tsukamurella phage TIN3]AKJ72009.1 hypothetical protein TIN4_103 [Tsukamurella phage TIN4]